MANTILTEGVNEKKNKYKYIRDFGTYYCTQRPNDYFYLNLCLHIKIIPCQFNVKNTVNRIVLPISAATVLQKPSVIIMSFVLY